MLRFCLIILFICPLLGQAESPAQTLYLLGYDIPESERDSVVAADIAAFEAYQRQKVNATILNPFLGETPTSKLEDYPSIDTRELILCSPNQLNDCLADIANDSIPYRHSMNVLASVFADIDTLRDSAPKALSSIFPPSLRLMDNPLPNYSLLVQPLITQSALAYHDGSDQGMAQICANVTFSKHLIQSEQNFIQSLLGSALLDSHLDLLSMTTSTLPSTCLDALEPMKPQTISICPLSLAEALTTENLLQGLTEMSIFYNRQITTALLYKKVDSYCSPAWLQNVGTDEIAVQPDIELHQPKLFNRVGSILLDTNNFDYARYQNRLQDANAYLKLWQEAIHPQCTTESAQFLNTIADDWHPKRNIRIDENQRLTINTYDTSNTETLSVSCRGVQ